MSILLIILTVIGSLIALVLIAGLIIKNDYGVSREIIVDKPVEEVFAFVRLQKNQELYNKWVMTDPNKKVELRGTDGTVGFIYAWNGNKQAGEGEVEITNLKENEQVDTEVRFVRPMPGLARISMITTPVSANQTRVTWGFTSRMKYPMNAILALMGWKKILGKDLQKSLGDLKRILEK